jgi:DegV family protein with EDD domain
MLPSHARALGILVVPNRVVLDGVAYRDGVDITAQQFFARLPRLKRMPYTTPAAPREFYDAYQLAFRQGATDVLSLHVSSTISNAFAHAKEAREKMPYASIQLFDTQQAGIGIWPALTQATLLANQGAPLDEVVDLARSVLARTRLFFVVETLEYLRRNGRVGRVRALLGTLMDAHPVLTIRQGEVVVLGTVQSFGRALQHMRDLALAEEAELVLISASSIGHVGRLESLLQGRYSGQIERTWSSPTIGANTGPAVGMAVVVR